jgi:hypothetical protein
MRETMDVSLGRIVELLEMSPRDLKYKWPQGFGPDCQPVQFTDAFGRQMLIPFELCQNAEVRSPNG